MISEESYRNGDLQLEDRNQLPPEMKSKNALKKQRRKAKKMEERKHQGEDSDSSLDNISVNAHDSARPEA